MEYNFKEIEKRWQQYWIDNKIYKVTEDTNKPKYYVLDMFPYPSGAGLHVGHPLGYIASDIFSRYKRLKGFNVLHPMGYDAYGLPAEQYAIQTGQHPAITTEQNIKRYREQLDKIGFSFDWSREVQTCDPRYYKWTQWAFIKMFNSYYCNDEQQARPIEELIEAFGNVGTEGMNIACSEELNFTAAEWNAYPEEKKQEVLLNYRIAYLSDTTVNWCSALGTVLANDEVINGLSERGGYPVEQRLMRQWSLRVSAYAQRLLDGLDTIDWSESIKETQRNWIGRSEGAEIHLPLAPSKRGGNKLPPNHTTNKSDWNTNIDNARENRKNPTEAENILWQMLRGKALGYKFRRQHLIDRFIVDFVCFEKGIIIEVDGGYHNTPEQKEYDEQRSAILTDLGYQILRFSNEEVIGNIDEVLTKIKSFCEAQVPSFGGDLGEVVVFTTRADTIFGVTFMVLAPESEYVPLVTTPAQKAEVEEYQKATKRRTERDRQMDKKVSGVFTGSYAINPLNGKEIPIWVADYVLAGYGTGAIMAVPGHDSRDHAFAKHFNLPIIPLIEGADVSEESFDAKEGVMMNSGFLNGLQVKDAIEKARQYIKENDLGRIKVNYRLRDAIFSRQRYWGEPFPVYYKGDIPYMLPIDKLPLELPEVDKYLPTETGEPPLGRATKWAWDTANEKVVDKSLIDHKTIFPLELNTMPGFAGSSAYYLQYMDPYNPNELVAKDKDEYWRNVDLYIGGTEHATGHLIYSRFWNKFLYDINVSCEEEPFKKLINQGMIQGRSNFVYRINGTNKFVSHNLKDQYEVQELHVDVNIVHNDILDLDAFKAWRPEFASAEFILEDGKYICGWAIEKMSKSYHNVVNPDDMVDKYGADTLRMYEMFLGPLEQSKPWDTNGVDGVNRFLRKTWGLFYKGEDFIVTDEAPTKDELKTLHKLIKKVSSDIESFSFNTSVSAFMICVNELTSLKCSKKAILQELIVVLAPFAPFISEQLWSALGNTTSVCYAEWPAFNEEYLVEDVINYTISFNGKARFNIEFAADASNEEIEKTVLAHQNSIKWMEGKTPKKVIIVPKKIVNIVL
ncbi:leucyl-tRNA synthetase [Dysgonomonas sp. PFB1-18]|uniref:leucine--tRNA ligase n=1 Tax=unclassified Dysgonomonas TaxID=2630389 RepID=UPI002476FAAF|nr:MULTISPECIES: leucine--tRNA ligase [unclassified Dysgonomonas]MDH6310100.1 leucyl-tRNA synthetase [Dysgonomonas sp. PF1-14]MDH6340234.1 leucyl-tRNA synthetase [Dysgonomonas sp. PF1-16]MDH6381657.1 leucyl-tRNA synthetase [Dysgonomonas sp. PFB1-18]MDH6399016.1 leucyl-tRNA synthetase [Dysgonomonas sp. PF1-23]